MKKFWMKLFLLLTLFLMVSACTKVYRSPGAENMKPSELGILEHSDAPVSKIDVASIDGKRRGAGFITRYELTPGEHSITVYLQQGKNNVKSIRYFVIEANKTYSLNTIIELFTKKYDFGVFDNSTGKQIDYKK